MRHLHLTFVLCSASQSKVKILQNFVVFSEYMNFNRKSGIRYWLFIIAWNTEHDFFIIVVYNFNSTSCATMIWYQYAGDAWQFWICNIQKSSHLAPAVLPSALKSLVWIQSFWMEYYLLHESIFSHRRFCESSKNFKGLISSEQSW